MKIAADNCSQSKKLRLKTKRKVGKIWKNASKLTINHKPSQKKKLIR